MTPIDIAAVERACKGWRGRFECQPERTESRSAFGGGDWTTHAPRLAYVPDDIDDDDYDAHYTIMGQPDEHVGESLALMLNALPHALAEIARLRALVEEAFREGFMLAEDHAEVSEDDGWHRCAPHIDWTIANREFDKRKEEIRNAAKGAP